MGFTGFPITVIQAVAVAAAILGGLTGLLCVSPGRLLKEPQWSFVAPAAARILD